MELDPSEQKRPLHEAQLVAEVPWMAKVIVNYQGDSYRDDR